MAFSYTCTISQASPTEVYIATSGIPITSDYDVLKVTLISNGNNYDYIVGGIGTMGDVSYTVQFSAFSDGANQGNPFIPLNGTHSYTVNTIIIKTGGQLAASNNPVTVSITYNGGGGACFTSSSRLLTPTGYKTADKLRTGDLLVTPDGRQVPIKAFQTRVLGTKETAPFLVPKHSLSASSPAQDLHLSPWHAIQVRRGVWQKPATAAETNSRIVQYGLGENVSYFHFEAPNYFTDNLVCDGTVVESFANKQVKGDGKVYHYNRALKGYTRSAVESKKLA